MELKYTRTIQPWMFLWVYTYVFTSFNTCTQVNKIYDTNPKTIYAWLTMHPAFNKFV